MLQGLWSGLYQRWQKQQMIQHDLWQEIVMIKEHDKELKSKVIKLRRWACQIIIAGGGVPLVIQAF